MENLQALQNMHKTIYRIFKHANLVEQRTKDPSEIIPRAQDCGENWMFSFAKTFSWIFVEVLGWIALDAAADEPAVFISANARWRATWRSDLLWLMKSVVAKVMSWNCSHVGFQACIAFMARDSSDMAIFHVPRTQNININSNDDHVFIYPDKKNDRLNTEE